MELESWTWIIPQRAARTLDKGPPILGILGIFGQPILELNFLSFLTTQEQGEGLATAKEEQADPLQLAAICSLLF